MTKTRAAGLLIALTALNILNFADRLLLVAFSAQIVPELKLTNLQFGLLTGIVFTGVYTVFGLFAGSLADRVNRPRLIAGGLAVWSALTAATGVATTFVQIIAARMFVGIGEACLTPAALSLIADRLPPARRAFAAGVYYMGYPIGVGGSFIFAGLVGPAIGWRGGFIVLGLIGVVAAVLVLLLLRETRAVPAVPLTRAAGGQAFAESLRAMGHELRHNPAFALTLAGCTLMIFAQSAAVLDLLWWVRERGYAITDAQRITGTMFLFGGVAGAVLGGIGADWAHQRFAAGRLKFLGWIFLATAPLALAYRIVPAHTPTFYALGVVATMLTLVLYGPAVTALQELVPARHRASAVAVFLLCAALIGASTGNAVVGWLADVFTVAGRDQPITLAVLVTQSLGLLAIPALFLAARYQAKRQATGTAALEAAA